MSPIIGVNVGVMVFGPLYTRFDTELISFASIFTVFQTTNTLYNVPRSDLSVSVAQLIMIK